MYQALFAGAALIIVLVLYYLTHLETFLFSLSKSKIQDFSESKNRNERWIAKRFEESNAFEIFFVVIRALLFGLFILVINQFLTVTFELNNWIILLTNLLVFWFFAILVFQVLPMYFAMKNNNISAFSKTFGRFLYYFFIPLTFPWKIVLTPLLNRNGSKSLESLAFERELSMLLPGEESTLDLEPVERQMIKHIIEFSDTSVREIMSPRVDTVCIKDDIPISEAIQVIKDVGHSRLPIYNDRIDNIIGILYAKDLLIALNNNKSEIDLKQIARKAYFVPESKAVSDLLTEFRNRKIHMAVVVDEYGGVAGLVTMEDILEEIVGEIQDEYDAEEAPIEKLADDAYLVAGKTTIDEINEFTGLNLPTEEDFDSIGGMVFHKLGEVPESKAKIYLEDQKVLLIVEEIDGHKIEKIKIILKDDEKVNEND